MSSVIDNLMANVCEETARQNASELEQVNESLQRREGLLSASARASQLLLEADDVMAAVPHVLEHIGEAARVDRVSLLLSQTGANGEPLLIVTSEWVADGVVPHLGNPVMAVCDERNYPQVAEQLRAGHSVCMNKDSPDDCRCSLQGAGTKSKAIVPIFVDGGFVGVVGFDNTRQRRAIGSAELSALETAAGVIGAALHRERLVDAVRRERERAAEDRVAALMERNRIGQEIHDGLAQAFTGILMQLGAAEELNGFGQDSPMSKAFERIRNIAKEGLTEARRSVLAMRPDQARRGGLALALRQLAERSTVDNRVMCSFEGKETVTGLPPEHEHELFRIAQEAVSNAMRHAQPSTVRIEMKDDSSHWMLAIADNGCGMEQMPELYAQQGFGLTNMRERANAIGGEWQIASRRSEGTRISVRVPKPAVV